METTFDLAAIKESNARARVVANGMNDEQLQARIEALRCGGDKYELAALRAEMYLRRAGVKS